MYGSIRKSQQPISPPASTFTPDNRCNKDIIHVRQYIVDQLQMALQNKDKQESGILGIIDVWCDHRTSPPCLFNAHDHDLCHHTQYSMPMASYNFLDLPWIKLKADKRLLYLHQTLLGLAELHDQNLVHGNIRPGSLLILGNTARKLRLDSESLAVQKVVLSPSMSCVQKKMFDSTRICVAPEIRQNRGATTDLDGTKIDIWGIASSWLYAFATPPNREIATKDTHKWLQGQLDRLPTSGPFTKLLRKMLAWEPRDRPTVAEALASDAWQLVWTEKEKVKDKKKRRREGKMQSNGAKRVRVLTPEKENYKIFES
ncbi:hypothetical protein V8C35DRAFT_318817 [Trichoderma chlorosporum]